MKKNILVTGGAGFIGSALVRYLLSETQHHVINVDKLSYASDQAALAEALSHPRYSFEKEDICNRSEISMIFERYKPDIVMHLAAESHVDRSISGPADFIQSNIIGTYTLLEVARDYWSGLDVQKKSTFRFHHISTDEVYGDLDGSDALFTEDTPYKPSSPYAASKASADHLVRAWHRTYGLPVILTNCSNNYGPHQYPEKLIPLVILNALQGKELPVYGKGDQIRDWLYVDDHVRALYLVAITADVGSTYNIGGHNEKTNLYVVQEICRILDALVPRTTGDGYGTLIRHVQDRPGHDRRYAIDADKIQRDLGWAPDMTFEDGLRKTVEWYLDRYGATYTGCKIA